MRVSQIASRATRVALAAALVIALDPALGPLAMAGGPLTQPRGPMTPAGPVAQPQGAVGQAQPRYGPAASTRILGGPAVTLEAGAPDWGAYVAAFNLLRAAGVRFVLEDAPVDPDRPQVDLARPAGHTIILTGLSVGAALDRIRRENPRFRWAERDGVIVASFLPPGAGVLAMSVPRLSMTDANSRTAMGALIDTMAPAWDASARITIGPRARLTPGLPDRPVPAAQLVSINIATPTRVEDVLVRLARESRAWSWTVQYDRVPASLDTAKITIIDANDVVTATSPSITPRPARFDANTPRPGRDLPSLLTEFARTAGVVINIEHLSVPPELMLYRVPDFDLTSVPPATTVRRLVAHDSRYEWTERDGRFIVRPKGTSNSILDTTVPAFVRAGEPLDDVLTDLLTRLGAVPRSMPAGAGRGRGGASEAERKLVTVEFRTPTSARDVLDALAAQAGGASWSFRGGPSFSGRSSYDVTLRGPDGWTVSRAFTLNETVRPTRPPEVAIPPHIERDIVRVEVPGAWEISPYLAIAAAAAAPIGIELRPERWFERDPRFIRTGQLSFMTPSADGKLSNFLFVQLERDPASALRVNNGVINIAPRETWALPRHFLDQPIGRFSVESRTAWEVAVALRQRMNPEAAKGTALSSAPPEFGPGRENQWAKTLTFTLDQATPRSVLNVLVAQHGNLAWLVRYQNLVPERDADVRNTDAVVVLSLLNDPGSAPLQVDVNGAMTLMRTPARGSPFAITLERPPGVPPGPPPGGPAPPAHLYFPTRVGRVDSNLDRLCRGLGGRCVIEVLTDELRTTGPAGPNEAYYDFTGMPIEAALDVLTRILPDLTWRREGTLYRIRSRGLDAMKDLPLDRRVASFEHDLPTVSAVRDAMRRVLLTSLADGSPASSGPGVELITSGGQAADRPIAVRMRNATIREILNEISRAHGELTWGVRYLYVNGTMPQLELSFSVRNSTTGSVVYLPGK